MRKIGLYNENGLVLYGSYIIYVNQQNLVMLTSPMSTAVNIFGEIIHPGQTQQMHQVIDMANARIQNAWDRTYSTQSTCTNLFCKCNSFYFSVTFFRLCLFH